MRSLNNWIVAPIRAEKSKDLGKTLKKKCMKLPGHDSYGAFFHDSMSKHNLKYGEFSAGISLLRFLLL